MKAITFDGRLKLEDRPRPTMTPHEALIRVRMAGICKTDAEILRGYMNFSGILGHEFVGLVEDAHDSLLIGKRVVGEINCGCGVCPYCKKGLARHCPNRTVLGIQDRDGVFAEYTTLPMENLLIVPDAVPDEAAVFVEPIAAALEVLEQIHIEPADAIAVIGDGKLGLLISMVLRLSGADVLLVGKHLEKMAIFERLGGKATTVAEFRSSSRAFSKIVEASGNPSGWELAVSRIAPRGVIVLKSTYQGAVTTDLSALVVNEITVAGSRCGQFAPALRLLETGLIDPSPLISDIYDSRDALQAFQKALSPGVLKILIRWH
jgi:alcohol dehydrogenase|uniref:Alcohol dehydrogenase n=1 Tax=Desulfomonile tiedjei TaxID=2358 RepID=A0A7C4ASL5_9BACT